MEFFTHTRIFSTRWSPKMDVCIFYVYLYVSLSSPFVICKHELQHKIEEAKISVSYINEFNSFQKIEQYDLGKYGEHARVNTNPITGQLVQVQTLYNKSELGCSALDPAIIPNDVPWIALVKRGTCNFNEKVYFATILNAVAVIVYDHMSITEDTITIDIKGARDVQDVVAILIRYDKGKDLVDMLKAHNNINITITRAPKKGEQQECPGQLNNTSVLFVSISFIVSSVVFSVICRLSNATHDI